jgi:hypothetical protein
MDPMCWQGAATAVDGINAMPAMPTAAGWWSKIHYANPSPSQAIKS